MVAAPEIRVGGSLDDTDRVREAAFGYRNGDAPRNVRSWRSHPLQAERDGRSVLQQNVAPGVHRIEDSYTNWYIVEKEGRLTVVDAGVPIS